MFDLGNCYFSWLNLRCSPTLVSRPTSRLSVASRAILCLAADPLRCSEKKIYGVTVVYVFDGNITIAATLYTTASNHEFPDINSRSISIYLLDRSRCDYYVIHRVRRYPDHRRETQAHADYFRPRRVLVVAAVLERFILHALKHEDELKSERNENVVVIWRNSDFASFDIITCVFELARQTRLGDNSLQIR